MNKIILMGRLTKDPQLRYVQGDKACLSFTLAVERRSSSDDVDYIHAVAWCKLAEFINSHVIKGERILIEGRLKTTEWIDSAGNKRQSIEVVAEHMYFADGKREKSVDDDLIGGSNDVAVDDLPF